MKGIKLAILFSSLIFSVYAEDPCDASNLMCSKTYFPDEEGTMPSISGDDPYAKKNKSQSEKEWVPQTDTNETESSSSLFIPKAGKEVFDEDE